MKELAKSILVYVVIVTVLRGLITNPKYSQYFQFFSGIIMILLLLSPALSVLDYESDWYDLFEENILQMDLDGIKEEMSIADGRFSEIVMQEYEEIAAEQVIAMAKERGITAEQVEVKLCEEDEEWKIEEITVVAGDERGEGKEPSVETARVGKAAGINGEDTSADAEALRRQICSYFIIGEDKVHIWK